ncbi:MAG: hypothetical protein AAB069_09420 [Planctomycetota bacterium]
MLVEFVVYLYARYSLVQNRRQFFSELIDQLAGGIEVIRINVIIKQAHLPLPIGIFAIIFA